MSVKKTLAGVKKYITFTTMRERDSIAFGEHKDGKLYGRVDGKHVYWLVTSSYELKSNSYYPACT